MNDSAWMVFNMTAFSTAFLVISILVILFRTRALEMQLLLIGVFMAIAASMQANAAGLSVNAAQMTMSTGLGSGMLARASVILILAGIGMTYLARNAPVAVSRIEKGPPDVD